MRGELSLTGVTILTLPENFETVAVAARLEDDVLHAGRDFFQAPLTAVPQQLRIDPPSTSQYPPI